MRILAFLFLLVSPLYCQTSLIPPGAVWKYLDNGTNQGTAWRATAFDDATWASGPAELGYGDGDEATVISFGPNASAKYITSYFRRAITVANPGSYVGLTLKVKRDDGIVVYVNGAEVYRNNMPTGTISSSTLASSAASDDGATWFSVNLSPTVLVAGTNVVAAEVHQNSGTSSDLSFNLELTASTTASITRGPYLQKGTANGSVVLRWRTNAATDSRVQYGLSAASLSSAVNDPLSTTEHEVTLTGLAANTTYFYSVGSTTAVMAGEDLNHFFVTPPPAGGQRATRIWVLGDAGTKDANQARVRDAYYTYTGSTHTDLWLMLGDNAYDNGTDSEYQAAVFDMYPGMLRKSVLWPTIGNHDTASSTNPPASLPYFQMFTLPVNGEAGGLASGTEKYYSFDFGNIHFVCLDSMTSSRAPGSAMLTWLQNDLASNTKDWLVAFFHHPPYTKGSHNSDTETQLIEIRQNVLPVLENYGVDLVLTGHSHSYERSFLIDGHYGLSTTFTNSMKINGGSGRPAETGAYSKPLLGPASHMGAVYAVAGSSGKISGGTLNHPAMFISLNALGSMVLDVNGGQLDAKFLTDTGTVADSFTMVKGAVANTPPTVSLTSPAQGATFTAPATVALAANAADADGTIQRVEFFQGTTLLGTDTTAPYTYSWTNVAAGSYSLTARAVDNLGAVTTSAAIAITVSAPQAVTLVAKGATWKYLDNGTDQGTAWRGVGFADTAWKVGPAELGYGDGGEATVVSYGSSSTNKYVTTYFRATFNVADLNGFNTVQLNLRRDDGAVVYVNGVEVTRSNMPTGTIGYLTLASSAVNGSNESTYFPFTVPKTALAAGANTIAVEVHQNARNSSDLSFDLELRGLP